MAATDFEIPKEKFRFAEKTDVSHDKIPETKPVSYMRDAFRRFCKNKGAVVAACIIAVLVLFALIAPLCTPYRVDYKDNYYTATLPKSRLFASTSFWDGCEARSDGKITFTYYLAMGQETGHNAVKNQAYTKTDDELYRYRLDSYHKTGVVYINLSQERYSDIQKYQDETGKQVIYPTLRDEDRPKSEQDSRDGNYYYRTTGSNRTQIVYDANGNVIPVYWRYEAGTYSDGYTSRMRIEGADGITENGINYYYCYAKPTSSGVECRVNYYEYYIYNHTRVLNDGIEEPYFIFGTTGSGQDILTCLSSGARFSFLFSIAVACTNMLVGALYGAIEGYYGGKTDIIMERIVDILSAVPIMIVITLLKYHMGGSSHILILFLAFFLTGWIGMAGRTRMQFYRYKNQEYVLAARTLGARDRRIMWKHIFPNALGTLVTSCSLVIPSMIYSEVSLTYLGIINLSSDNITSVGTLIEAGQKVMATFPHVVIFPSVFLVLLMLSFNLFGNGLRDAFNPSLRGSEG